MKARGATILVLLAAVAAAVPLACGDTGELAQPSAGGSAGASTGQPEAGSPVLPRPPLSATCERACAAAVGSAEDSDVWATCYACRCVAELGPLPAPSDLTCAKGELAPIQRVVKKAGAWSEERVLDEQPTCANPSLLDSLPVSQACTPGVRLGQLTTPKAIFKWICRRRDGLAKDATDLYDDIGIIGHNPSTGATCFWFDRGDADHRSDGVLPALDVSDGDPQKLAQLHAVAQGYEGDRCVTCHDNDPFMFSPHLEAVWRFELGAYLSGPYAQVRIAGTPTATSHQSLVSPQAGACLACHRLTNGRTCETWVQNATGNPPAERPFQAELLSGDPGLFPFLFWMPHPLPETRASWDTQYADSVAFVRSCCATPTAPGCTWEPVPGYRPAR